MAAPQESSTKARLLQAGRKVFAERGLENATIREICSLAEANVAAVNYHFGSKERLYIAVLQDYIQREDERHPHDEGVTPQSAPEDRLRAYLRGFLLQTLGDGDPENERLGKLLTQEFIEPSQYFGEIFDRHCRPSHELLKDIVRLLLPGHDETTVARCASSIVGQCVLFDVGREALSRMTPDLALKAGNIEHITDFIMEFSLGGIARLNARRQQHDKA
ncbi:MAG: CerR family C-terminal domain-containing protein [Humidesulfovibrio sp.]|nr:CerR family C-terminal domain-containing protein [Humidesulfovibrio sp.]